MSVDLVSLDLNPVKASEADEGGPLDRREFGENLHRDDGFEAD